MPEDEMDPEEYDKLRRRVFWKMPTGLYVIGSRDGDRRNGMTLNWITQLAFEPKLLGIAVENTSFTHELISNGQVFAVSFIDREQREIVRKFTKRVEVEGQTMNGYGFHDGMTGAPILDDAVAFLECELRNQVETGDHTLFIGEVVNCGFLKGEETEVLRMEDTRMNYGG